MDNEAYFKQAVASEKEGNVDLAATLYQRILDNFPTHPGTLYNLATLNAKRRRYTDAIHLYESMLAVEPTAAQACYNIAICYMKLSNVSRAVDYLEQAVLIDPQYEDAHHLLGGILLGMGECAKAEPHFQSVLLKNPDHASAHAHLGMVYVHMERMDDARDHLKKAIALDTSLVEAHYHLGLVQLHRGDVDGASTHFEDAVARDALHFSAYYNLALIKKTQGQEKLAKFYIEKAHEISPQHPFIAYLYGMLDASKAPIATPPEVVTSLFDHYAPYYEQHMVKTLRCDLPEKCLAVFQRVHPEKIVKTLDLGCGTGLCGVLFREQTQLLVGVDLSEKMLDKARMKGVYDALYQEDMLTILQREEHTVDLVICCDALVYVGALEGFFEALRGALQLGGMALLTCEAGDEPFALTRDGRYAHGVRYLRECIENAGMQVVAFETTTLREQNGQSVFGYIICIV